MDVCKASFSVIETAPVLISSQAPSVYGVRCVCPRRGVTEIPDITFERDKAEAFCELLSSQGACCVQLRELCEDFVACALTQK